MSVYRRHKEKNFTCIDNHLFEDKTLSMKAKGLLATILSLPDNWKYSVNGLASLFSDGRDAVNGAINELIKHGYITRTKITNKLGAFDGYQYDIYEKPQTESKKIADIPFTEEPFTGEPFTDNSTVSNTNLLNTNIVNTNSIDNIPLISPEEKLDLLFAEFWKAYPRKDDKKRAIKKFKAIKNVEKVLPDILADIEIKKKSEQWNENGGKYIPMPSTYLNNERWNDESTVTMQSEIAEAVSDEVDLFN